MKRTPPAHFLSDRLKYGIQKRAAAATYRRLPPADRQGVDFCSNDYLGISKNTRLQEEIQQRWHSAPGLGSTGSRLLSGNNAAIEQLEEELADFFGAEAALLFSTGYLASLAVLSSLGHRGDLLLYDRHIHACAKDAARLSQSHYSSFAHNDLNDLSKKLARTDKQRVIVITEGLFSMEGDLPPLLELVRLSKQQGLELMIDEAHSTGIFGPKGEGIAFAQGLAQEIPIRMHSFGKAWGTQGACILGSRPLIEYLINYARPFIYSTAPPPVQIHTLGVVLEHFRENRSEIKQLQERISYFTELSTQIPQEVCSPRPGPVQIFKSKGGPSACKAAALHLQEQGYALLPILSPTVRAGEERIRICLHSFNTKEEIKGLISATKAYLSAQVF